MEISKRMFVLPGACKDESHNAVVGGVAEGVVYFERNDEARVGQDRAFDRGSSVLFGKVQQNAGLVAFHRPFPAVAVAAERRHASQGIGLFLEEKEEAMIIKYPCR